MDIRTEAGTLIGDTPRDWLDHMLTGSLPNRVAYLTAVPVRPSGGWRVALREARAAETDAALRRLLLARMNATDEPGAWDPDARATCPKCGSTGRMGDLFGCRVSRSLTLDREEAASAIEWALETVPTDRLRASVRERNRKPLPKGSAPGTVKVVLPTRQAQCKACR